MCGISGIHGLDLLQKNYGADSGELMNASLRNLAHRGPDHSGFHISNQCILGHNRLRILDLSNSADQPMSDESGRYSLVFNGEIFNYQELKQKPELRDFPFKTSSDTEVLLALLIRCGKKILNELNGFFAFGFYDAHTNDLLIVRDRFGEKPLWYAYENGVLFFASELRALEAFPIPRELNTRALAFYLQLTYIPAPEGIMSRFHKLEAGHLIESSGTGMEVSSWYDDKKDVSENENLFELMNDAVRIRLLADVPVGGFLSGGLDSSIVCALAAKHLHQLHTYSIGFPEEPYIDESHTSSVMARHIGSRHTNIPLTQSEILKDLPEYLSSLDEPFADSSSIALYFLCKHTRREVTVALSGDGADELFAGYRKHRALWSAQKANLTNFLLKLSHPLLKNAPVARNSGWRDKWRQASKYSGILRDDIYSAYWKLASWADDQLVGSVLNPAVFDAYSRDRFRTVGTLDGTLTSILKADQKLVLANDMLTKTDSMSMASALEIRSPFMDYRIFEMANRMRSEQKINNGKQKWILRETFGHLLPPEVLHAQKKGFEVPLDRWVKGPLLPEISEALSELDADLFNKEQVMKLISPGQIHTVPPSFIWTLYVFARWNRSHRL